MPVKLTEIEAFIRMFGKVDIDIIQYLDLAFLGFYNNDIGKDAPLQKTVHDMSMSEIMGMI